MLDRIREAADPKSEGARDVRVLLVDDDARFRGSTLRLFRTALRDFSLQGLEAGTGAEAMELLSCEDIDCVLLDYQMPGGSGLEWLQRIQEEKPQVPVVIVTGHGDEHVAVEAMKSGACDYLVKGSISPENLGRAIRNATERAKMQRQIEAQRRQLVEAEKQRAMIQSLGAACHHLGQPATTLRCYLEIAMRREDLPEELRDVLKGCNDCTDQLCDVLNRLQTVSEFRTVPYRPLAEGEEARSDEEILDIDV